MEQNLELLANKNFQENINFLQQRHPNIFEKISSLSVAIENGHYKTKYELAVQNNNFDVLELDTNKYLYNGDILKHTKLSTQFVNYTKKQECFETFSSVSPQYAKKYLSSYLEIFDYIDKNSKHQQKLNQIDKFVFFGVGLGQHILSIHKKISAKVYLIVEDNLELFYLSLFTCNYQHLSKNSTLIFSILEDENEFSKSAQIFLETEYQLGHFIKYYYLISHKEDKISLFHKEVSSQAHLKFYYTSMLTQYMQPLRYIKNSCKFISNTLHFNNEALNKEKFLLIAAGPSLQKNIFWLQKNHLKFITIAVSATLPYLEASNIVPDIIVNLDGFDEMNTLIDKIKSMDFFKNSICLFSARTQEYISDKFHKELIFFFESSTKYKKTPLRPVAPCVGSLTYQLLLLLRVKNIYLLGLDLAIDTNSSTTHLGIHTGSKKLNLNADKYDDKDYHKTLIKLEGNFTKEVYSSYYFNDSRLSVNNSTKKFNKFKANIFNLSDGVKFDNITALDINKIDTNTKSCDTKELLLKLINHSACANFDDIKNFEDKLLQAKNLKQELNNFKSINSLKDYDNLIKHELLLSNKYELNKIIKLYMRYIITYIFDFFNADELINKDLHLDNLHNIFIKNIYNIIEKYITDLEDCICKR